MRWIPFAILLYIAAAFQVARFGLLSSSGKYPMPEYIILIAVFYAMYAADDAAILVGLLCGILLDVTSSSVLGTLTIPLALTCWAILKIRLSVFREHAISQIILTALSILVFALLALTLRWILAWAVKADPRGLVSWDYIRGMLENAVYTALLAWPLFWLLLKAEGLLGFGLRGPRARGH